MTNLQAMKQNIIEQMQQNFIILLIYYLEITVLMR